MLAVWSVLRDNYPSAFKRVDSRDASGTWADNLDDISPPAMARGLVELRKYGERQMPNAPQCRAIIMGPQAAQRQVVEPDDDPRSVGHIFTDKLRGLTWMSWSSAMVNRGHTFTQESISAAVNLSKEVVRESADTVDREPSSRALADQLKRSGTASLIAAFNRVCEIPEKIRMHSYEDLYGKPADSR